MYGIGEKDVATRHLCILVKNGELLGEELIQTHSVDLHTSFEQILRRLFKVVGVAVALTAGNHKHHLSTVALSRAEVRRCFKNSIVQHSALVLRQSHENAELARRNNRRAVDYRSRD